MIYNFTVYISFVHANIANPYIYREIGKLLSFTSFETIVNDNLIIDRNEFENGLLNYEIVGPLGVIWF